jgi:hypothetical protein
MIILLLTLIVVLAVFYHAGKRITIQESILSGKAIQLFDSLQIIDSTINLKTFNERIKFALSIIVDFSKEKDLKLLVRAIKKGQENYLRLHPDAEFTYSQSLLLDGVSNLVDKRYITGRINAFFVRFCDRKMDEINKLKTSAAKDRRRREVDECLHICRQITQRLGCPEDAEALSEISRPIFS